uniref:ARF like GTPase 10 n=1 Tax=Leptobrachium leishanense TaxID=445787 RepID=A0A8C5N3A1_9ANUR
MAALQNLSMAVGAAVSALGTLMFMAWSRYFPRQRRRRRRHQLEYMIRQPEENYLDRQILVLGLDEAGKSSVIHTMSTNTIKSSSAPTHGFNSATIRSPGLRIELLEVGGSFNLRTYWLQYLKNAHIIVFVVDSTDERRLPLARHELHRLLEAAPQLPIMVLANKQDRDTALSISDIHTGLSLHNTASQRAVTVLGTSARSDGGEHSTPLQTVLSLLQEKLHSVKRLTQSAIMHNHTDLLQTSLETMR